MSDFVQPWGDLPEVNFDAGRLAATYKPSPFKHLNIVNMPNFYGLSSMLVVRYALRAEKHYLAAKEHHANGLLPLPRLNSLESMFEEIEYMIYCMRKSLDHIMQEVYISIYGEEVKRDGVIKIDSLGRFLRALEKGTHSDLRDKILNGASSRSLDFLRVLNTISNAYKHAASLSESLRFTSPEWPAIVILDVPNSNIFSSPVVHNHSAVHIMMGFQDTFDHLMVALGAKPLFAFDTGQFPLYGA